MPAQGIALPAGAGATAVVGTGFHADIPATREVVAVGSQRTGTSATSAARNSGGKRACSGTTTAYLKTQTALACLQALVRSVTRGRIAARASVFADRQSAQAAAAGFVLLAVGGGFAGADQFVGKAVSTA